jgi:hypothetical protein
MDPTLCTRVPKDPPASLRSSAHFPANFPPVTQHSNSRPFLEEVRGRNIIYPDPLCRVSEVHSRTWHLHALESARRLILIRASWSLHKEHRAVFVLLVKPLVTVLLREFKVKISYDARQPVLFERMVFDIPAFRYRSPKEGL